MILSSYPEFRYHFATVARTSGVSLTYNHLANPDTIARASGSFVTDGFTTAMSLDVFGTTANDGRYTIASVSALTLQLGGSLTSSETIVSDLTGAQYEVDGAETWPLTKTHVTTFESTWSPVTPVPIRRFPVTVTINGGATDVSAGSSYTWYVRQKTDDSTLQWMLASHTLATKTGTITLQLTQKCVDDLSLSGATAKLNEHTDRVLRNVTLFVKRLSDGAIQFIDLDRLSAA